MGTEYLTWMDAAINDKSVAIGKKVIIKIIEQDEQRKKYGNIIIPDKNIINDQLLRGEVVSVGPDTKGENLKTGDVVLYDKLSAYYRPSESPGTYIITDIENVVCIIPDENGIPTPIGDRILLEQTKRTERKITGTDLVLPEIADDGQDTSTVIRVGKGCNEEYIPVVEGNSVIAYNRNMMRITIDQRTFVIVPSENLLAKLS
jgi:co-chaperonin GroES (HSP10)